MQTYSYYNSSIINDVTRVMTNPEDAEFIQWHDGWTEQIRSPEVWSDAVPETPATFDAEGVELTPLIPAVPSVLISGGEVIETIVHEPHVPSPYVAPPKSQTQVIESIKSERDRRKNGGTLVSGKWFHSDTESRVQQLGLVIMGAAVPAVQWKTMDGTFVTMSQTLAGGIFQATATLDMTLYAVAEGHINAVKMMADPTTYDYSTGWPAAYTPL